MMKFKALMTAAVSLLSGVIGSSAFAQSAPRLTPQGVIVNPVQSDLRVNVAVNKSGENPLYIEGEKLRVSVSVNQDAFVYLFNITANGEVVVLLPNGFSRGTPQLRANETRTFPSQGDQYELTIAAPYGQERILALASKRQLNLNEVIPQLQQNNFVTATVQGQEGLARTLAVVVTPLPPRDWTTDAVAFRTQARNTAPTTGSLQVNSNVGGAAVLIDGVRVGNTPLSVNVGAGQRNVRVVAEGYREETRAVNITGGQTTSVTFNLQPIVQNGQLTVIPNPSSADVYVDNVRVGRGTTSVNIPAGQHNVRVSANGFQDFSTNINVTAGGTVTVRATLTPTVQNGTLVINTTQGASVFVDGVRVGTGNTQIVIPSGAHNVRVTLEGYQDFNASVNVRANQTTTVDARLQGLQGQLVVRSQIATARVFINGEEVGRIGNDGGIRIQNLPAGTHELVVIAPGYRAFVTNFTIQPGQVTEIFANLPRI
jgi:Domain of unknown function (DUF4384)/PEGA domain